jgi:RNA polymerase sigma-70 factor (ECF subfamily)
MTCFQNGSMEAFETLYERYRTPIYAFLVRQSIPKDSAQELAQDIFVKVVRSASSFSHASKFSTWIYTIARNQAVDAFRKGKHRNHPSLDQPAREDGAPLKDRVEGKERDPERATTATRLRGRLEAAIRKLPEDQREVFLLREYNGLRFQEIGEVVGAKVGTVKSRMRYALEFLKRELAEYEDYARTLP